MVFSYKNPAVTCRNFNDDFTMLLDKIYMRYINIAIVGDLNFDMFNKKSPLYDICDIFSFVNLIQEPTYYHSTGHSSIDVFLTNKNPVILNQARLILILVMVTCSFMQLCEQVHLDYHLGM